MKKVRIISLLLVLCLVTTLVYPLPAKAAEENGMVINKTATANDDGTYTIQLEAYATGSKIITETTKDVPTDIVLVLDQSGSMSRCIVCGETIGYNSYHTTYTFNEKTFTSAPKSGTYYIKTGETYTEVEYCDGEHGYNWNSTKCDGGAGWYVANGGASDHTETAKITPKTNANPSGTQFYTRGSGTREACKSRLDSLKTAVTTFVNSVSAKAAAANVDHRVAIVGFASTGNSYTNTELLSTNNVVNYGSANANNYRDALVSVNDNGALNARLRTAITRLAASGDTYLQYGMDMANEIFAQYPIEDTDRQRVVVVFTDGYPAPSGTDTFNYSMADAAIANAYTTKNAYGATVYSVAVLQDANPTASITDGYRYDGTSTAQQTVASNRYLHYVSSNYPSAQSMSNGGSLNSKANPFNGGDSYYLSAGNAETLNNIFQQISDQIESGSSSSSLTEEAVVKDIIAPKFTLPAGATAENIALETYSCTGKTNGEYTWTKNADAMGATATVNGDNVDVTGFNFSENYVAEITQNGEVTGYQGDKLVITFTVEPKAGYLGGNSIETNASAGIYEDANATEPIVTFPKPVVNVPIDTVVVANADDQNVYLYDTLTGADLMGDAYVTVGNVELQLNEENFGLAEWQNADVNIVVEITDKDGKTVTDETFAHLVADSEYNIKVTVSPKNTAHAAEGTPATTQSGEDDAKINVFKPVITFNDTAIDLGETADYADNGGTVEQWLHGTTDSTKVTMDSENAPTLTYDYSPEAGAFTEETDVKVTVTIGNSDDLSEHVIFYRDACDFADCEHKTKTKVESTADRVNFVVHIDTFDLTITKAGVENEDSNAAFVFNVSGNGINMDVVIYGNNSVTIKNLPAGEYTVKETGGYWRYTLDTHEEKASATNANVTFTNKLKTNQWLDDIASVTNKFTGDKADSIGR